MAEINKLSVGQVLDKLRSTDVPKSKITRLKEKTEALDEEIQRSRAARRRLDQGAGWNGRARGATTPRPQECKEKHAAACAALCVTADFGMRGRQIHHCRRGA